MNNPCKYFCLEEKKGIEEFKTLHHAFKHNISLNPYTGCVFGCQYCYSLSASSIGEEYTPKIGVRTNLPFQLRELLKNTGKDYVAAIGTTTDPYQPIEKELMITRRCLEIAVENELPVHIFTKSDLVLRDLDILQSHSKKGLSTVIVSISSIRKKINNIFEPFAPEAEKRLKLISKLKSSNILVGAAMMPILPYINDGYEQFEELFDRAKDAGAEYIVPGVLVLNNSILKERLFNILNKCFPGFSPRYESLYDKDILPNSAYDEKIISDIKHLSNKYNLLRGVPVDNSAALNTACMEPVQ